MNSGNILIVDDEEEVRALMVEVLSDEGYTTTQASNEQEAIGSIKKNIPDMVFLDLWLGDNEIAGIELLEKIKSHNYDVPVVMISGHGTIDVAVEAIKKGAFDFIEKPFVIDRLLLMCSRAMELRKLKQENIALRHSSRDSDAYTVGVSPFVASIRQVVDKIATTNSRVFIKSPIGVGADAIAYDIHKKSHRRTYPFVYVNCICNNFEKFDNDLFGTDRKLGHFQQADNGTIFLDDVSKLSQDTQRRLMSFLQEGRYGIRNRNIYVDVRIICSSSEEHIAYVLDNGLFSRELFYRLNISAITIPPIDERREDIVPLLEYYLARSDQLFGFPRKNFSEKALAILQSYNWPGNIYQIRNVVESSLINAGDSGDNFIHSQHIPQEITSSTKEKLDALQVAKFVALPLKEAKDAFESDYLRVQVERFSGNISQTAAFIGMERSALHRKLKLLNVGRAVRNAKKKK
ncbi:MAG: sigma-54 dependent transcriptional regulator [Holosporaceae bacterium]|jgi:two-component system nitrogen regulation response regulator NtrX|nr:sigma-54 dependent transcriptional regulator [Holosporaceae bacterium]